MPHIERLVEFKKSVNNKFNVYNSLFLNLPYRNIENVGMLIPLLLDQCQKGLGSGLNPQEILEKFFENYAHIDSEKEQIDFMFKIIQYVERQVVLYDSVEDAAFPKLQEHTQSLSIKDYFQLVNKNKSWDKVSKKLSSFSARLVLTAHPTQFYTPAVLDIIEELRSLILEDKIDDIDITLQQLGLTSLINSKKPTPLDEAKNIIYFLRHVYYNAVGDLYAYIKENIKKDDFENHNIMKLGFWPGGDRDGNPFVTADITKDVADELRINLMKCYYNDLKIIQKKLTFKDLQEPIQKLRGNLYTAMFDSKKTVGYNDILQPLLDIKELLINKYHSLYLKELENFIDKVKIFKTHFATLDVRQDHSKHKLAIESILKNNKLIKESVDELSEEALVDLLINKDLKVNASDYSEDIVKDTITNIKQLKSIQDANGEEGCNRYIISNSEDIFSVLFVFGLFRWCGWKKEEITFDIVPLFETMNGMEGAEKTMQTLFDLPDYKAHLERRNHNQTIMLGFSDGTKDGGYLKANWAIFKTKETLSKVCDKNGFNAIFFDGRGGPPARGGGKTHRFYAAQTKSIANHEIQLTIQGQTITSTYGTKEQFIHNSEQLLTAGLSNNLFGKENVISKEHRKLIEQLSELSFKKYDALKNHDKFIPYLENRSTLKYYQKANIGSRPGKRGNKKKLELTDLRAISFVGSWSQLKQNVPGYFGIGTAIQTIKNEGRLSELKKLYKEVPFFKALMHNSMMSLSKCYFELTSYMQKDEEYGDFWNILHEEYQLSKKMLLLISGSKILMENEAVSRESIKIRENIVLPLLVIQQFALQRIGQDTSFKDEYEKIVTRSLYGNINASRNSA
ncbi:phosphoenolpyruvate carboxylase [Zobellia galactanivorans]|uniref:phosphoenolpyruvate carboxylase n=1 Tax=Zobellia TaxID=112040 RepID=UPI000B52F140|nr:MULTISPECIES: phosphoenolpyruvate carboxylase [Zobellia]MBU3027313.1 phosphoenolpyruvate carboxylase [Zobellia galactanivorans]MDO6809590.1 phosphoenolpyruvate carboxylase [Zobellia galactanivorans]OWW23413.1 phosphoenolpyruvate carboxylase [Zobellia sp. OII3]